MPTDEELEKYKRPDGTIDWPPARRAFGSERANKYYVYLLKSLKDGKYYIGQTNDLYKRLEMHNNGLVKSTRKRRPFILIGYEIYPTREKARWREYQLKHHSDKKIKFIRQLLMKPITGPKRHSKEN
jgi:putative endonuclease